MKKPKPIKRTMNGSAKRKRGGSSVPCPECGAHSHVLRTTLGERIHTSRRKRDYVVRERRCVSPAHHKFHTEERSR